MEQNEKARLEALYSVESGWQSHSFGSFVKGMRTSFGETRHALANTREHMSKRKLAAVATGAVALGASIWQLDDFVAMAYQMGYSHAGPGDVVSHVTQGIEHMVTGATSKVTHKIGDLSKDTFEAGVDAFTNVYTEDGELQPMAFTYTALGLTFLKTLYSPGIKRHGSHVSGFENLRYYISDRIYCWGEKLDFKQFRKNQQEFLRSQKQ